MIEVILLVVGILSSDPQKSGSFNLVAPNLVECEKAVAAAKAEQRPGASVDAKCIVLKFKDPSTKEARND